MEPGTRQLETVPMPQTLLKLFKLVSFELAYPFTHFFPRERLAYLFAWLLPPLTDRVAPPAHGRACRLLLETLSIRAFSTVIIS